jgi:hypothetical protein
VAFVTFGQLSDAAVIHYNVWFSFKEGSAEQESLSRVRQFLLDLKERGQVFDFTLLRHRADSGKTRLAPFHAQIVFADQDQFGRPFQEVAAAGMRTGAHGLMIENVDTFIVEIFEELP